MQTRMSDGREWRDGAIIVVAAPPPRVFTLTLRHATTPADGGPDLTVTSDNLDKLMGFQAQAVGLGYELVTLR